jgi:ribosome biogenesis GTPase
VSSLERLGWNSFFEEQRRSADTRGPDSRESKYARVVEEQRGLYTVAGEFDGWAEVSGRFRHDAATVADYPAVGDWVVVTAAGTPAPEPRPPDPGLRAVIHRRLERRSTIARAAAGTVVEPQVIAANVDTIFLVTALTRDLNPRRLERYLTIVWEAGAVPVIVLNKADLCADPDAASADVRARLPFVDVVAVSATREWQGPAYDDCPTADRDSRRRPAHRHTRDA